MHTFFLLRRADQAAPVRPGSHSRLISHPAYAERSVRSSIKRSDRFQQVKYNGRHLCAAWDPVTVLPLGPQLPCPSDQCPRQPPFRNHCLSSPKPRKLMRSRGTQNYVKSNNTRISASYVDNTQLAHRLRATSSAAVNEVPKRDAPNARAMALGDGATGVRSPQESPPLKSTEHQEHVHQPANRGEARPGNSPGPNRAKHTHAHRRKPDNCTHDLVTAQTSNHQPPERMQWGPTRCALAACDRPGREPLAADNTKPRTPTRRWSLVRHVRTRRCWLPAGQALVP